MDRDAAMDRRLRKRLRNLPTKQNHDPQKENTPLPHYHQRRHPPLSTNRHGSHHRTPAATRIQCDTNNRGPRMLTRSHLPPVLRYHHRARNRAALPRLRLPMVQSTNQNDQRSRPQIHLAFRQSPLGKARHCTELIYGISSSNRRTIGTEKPMDRTIPPIGHFERPKGMDTLARARYNSTQQSDQYYHQTLSQPNPLRVQPTLNSDKVLQTHNALVES